MNTTLRSWRSQTGAVRPCTLILLLCLLAVSHAGAVTFSALSSFYGTNGAQPAAGLTLGTDGNFYGTTLAGGLFGHGTVFMATHAGALTTLASFDGTNGAQPYAGLTLGTDGNFYGTASTGGDYGNGTVFVITPTGKLATLASFDGTNGAQPFAPLVQASDGNFYGTASAGGDYGLGTIFVVGSSGGLTNLASFNGTNGAQPFGGLALAQRGGINLYGTTSAGGAYNSGTIFSFAFNGGLASVYSFTGGTNGGGPQSGLLLGQDNNFYGTTAGGINGQGTLFRFNPGSSAVTSLLSFGGTNGAQPFAPLVQGTDSNFYGTTLAGGAYGHGTAFCLGTNSALTWLYSFHGGSDGAAPLFAGLAQGTNGNLYGVASAGGKGGKGTFYQISGFAPYIITPPIGNLFPAGATVTLSVAAGGSTPLSYSWLMNSTRLADGGRISGSRTPTLTISNVTTASAGTYTVVVRNPVGAVSNASAVVQVVNPPVVRITSPAQNVVLRGGDTNVTVTGTAADNVPVERVYWQLNGGGWQLATAVSGWSRWAASMTLSPGANTFQVYALNVLNYPSLTNSLNLIYSIGSAPVAVQVVSGEGTVSPVRNGQLLDISRPYIITTKPATGFVLSNLTVSDPQGVIASTDMSPLAFIMASNLLIQASFVPSPFTNGSYYGLFYDTNGGGVTVSNAGYFTAKVTSDGRFSARLQQGANAYPISGQFSVAGDWNITSLTGTTGWGVWLHLDLAGGDAITGTVSNSVWSAELAAGRAVYSGTNPATQAGQYTLVIPGSDDSADLPGGHGAAAVRVSSVGAVSVSGILGDGTPVTESTFVSGQGRWPLYATPYSGKGIVIGWLTFTNDTAATNDLEGVVSWIKPGQTGTRIYPNGFDWPYDSETNNAFGSAFTNRTPLLGWTNGVVILEQGNLTQSITNGLVIGSGGTATGTNSLKLTITTSGMKAGLFKGSVINPATGKAIPVNGALLQKQDAGYGSFLGTNQTGRVFLGP